MMNGSKMEVVMRNPNGFGSVINLGKNRRKPFAVRITAGYNAKNGKQIFKYLGYFKTKSEAMKCLSEYNLNPYDADFKKISFEEVFLSFYELQKNRVSEQRLKSYKYQYKILSPLSNQKMTDIKTIHLQKLFDTLNNFSPNYVREIKSLCGLIFKYAVQMDIINKDYSKYVILRKFEKIRENNVFSEEEQKKLWDNLEMRGAKEVLILIYTGFRASEFLKIRKENIDFKNWTIKGGLKTKAGKNRIIPVHEKIKGFVKELYNKSSTEFLNSNPAGTKEMGYTYFRNSIFNPLMIRLNMKHRIHDTRYTFATAITEVSQNNAAITKMIGHTNIEMTRKYSKTNIEKMRQEIQKIN